MIEEQPDRKHESVARMLKIVQEKGCVAPEYSLEDLLRKEYIRFGEPTKRIAHHHYRLTEVGKALLKQLELEDDNEHAA